MLAIGAWTMAGNFAARELTDGHVPQYYLDEIGVEDYLIELLIKADLWVADEDGICFKNWCEYQPSAEDYKAKQDEIARKRSANGKKGAEARWAMAKQWQTDGKPMANGMANEWQSDAPEPEPEPISTELNYENDFLSNEVIPDKFLEAALTYPKVDPLGEWRRFRSYYLSAPLKNAKNYDGPWKAWIEKANLLPSSPIEPPAYSETRAKDVESTKQILEEILTAKKRATDNPPPKCEHNRVAVLCCNS